MFDDQDNWKPGRKLKVLGGKRREGGHWNPRDLGPDAETFKARAERLAKNAREGRKRRWGKEHRDEWGNRLICRHCKKSNVNRPRGLCWTCYYTPGARALYPPTSKYARRGIGNFSGEAPLPTAPTAAVPGTAEKLMVMEARSSLKQSIFHPADALFEGDPRPAEWLKRQPRAIVNDGCAA